MRPHLILLAGCVCWMPALAICAADAPSPQSPTIKDLNTPRDFPNTTSQARWQDRAREIREQILVSAGLWPMPEKTPLHAHVFDRIERDGYSVEKVYLQTWPGFYLAGNLYRPLGKGNGPFPAILNPHGHWPNGRLVDTQTGSIPARCISFARQGMIAFSYDMVGYNDTQFADSAGSSDFSKSHRHFATNDAVNQLWNISLMGLQTWNSVRALDFLQSLPDADKARLAITGESGGGTQTMLLGAIDDRLAAQAPVVMVSHTMQGGCVCENMPGLRVEFSNVEIAAAAAPRPQIMVAATGDWTKTMPTMEGPAVEGIYRLFNAPEKLRYAQFDFPHNYNQTSREAVYQWFDHWLLQQPDAPVKEAPYAKDPDENLRVWADGKLPNDALTEQQMLHSLKQSARQRWQALLPHDQPSFEKYKAVFTPAWQHSLQVPDWPHTSVHVAVRRRAGDGKYAATDLVISRLDSSNELSVIGFAPHKSAPNRLGRTTLIILANPTGSPAYCDEAGKPDGLAAQLLERGHTVWVVKEFTPAATTNQFANFFTTYNRTLAQERVRDLTTLAAAANSYGTENGLNFRVVFCGMGAAGLWTLLAAPAADAVVADCNALDLTDDHALLSPDLFSPGLCSLGGFQGIAALGAPHPLLLHNARKEFPLENLQKTYAALDAKSHLKIDLHPLGNNAIVQWISRL